MGTAEIATLAESMIEEYRSILHIDPYFKITIELSEVEKVSECTETDSPATWLLRLSPTQHNDEIDVQMSVVSGMLSILFRDIEWSKRRDEVQSKLTNAIVQLTALSTGHDAGADDAGD